MPTQLSHEEIERMRRILAAHDQQNVTKEFDLNNPPKVPYKYQEFPRCMYHPDGKTTRNANNQAEMEAALASGWSKVPFAPVEEKPQLDAATRAEVAKVDEALGLAPKKRAGRKPKADPTPTE